MLMLGPTGAERGGSRLAFGIEVLHRLSLEDQMATKSVQTLLEDIRLLSEEGHALVQSVRTLAKKTLTSVSEKVKYGGILFSSDGVQFGGVFAYKEHVSVEFGKGASIVDPFGHLEGSGKGRRHVKLRNQEDISSKHLTQYMKLALEAARRGAEHL